MKPETIHKEFTDLQHYSNVSSACVPCTKSSIKCCHPKPTICDKIKEIRRKRALKPIFLIFCLHFFLEFCAIVVWQPYIIQVLKAFGTPINANLTTVISAGLGISASIFLISTVKTVGRRRLYLTSISIVTICSFGLSKWTCSKNVYDLEVLSCVLWRQLQVFMALFSSQRAGHHFESTIMNRQTNMNLFEVLWAITAI